MECNYERRLQELCRRKLEQTLAKKEHNGYMNEDDYGCVLPPENFHFEPEFNDPEHHTFYGARLWGRNFRRLMERHPLYVDPNDALAGRWMFILQRLRPFTSAVSNSNMEMAPVFNYEWLKPTQEKYGIIPGIGKMHHFAPDYQIGLQLGFGGLLDKVRQYARQYPEKAEFYQAEEDVLFGIRCWISRTVDEIRRMEREETDEELKENLRKMAEVNEWLIDGPPRTFREACQFMAWVQELSQAEAEQDFNDIRAELESGGWTKRCVPIMNATVPQEFWMMRKQNLSLRACLLTILTIIKSGARTRKAWI